MRLTDGERILLLGAIGGILCAGVIVAVIFATGSTFGQRCARHFPHGSADWETCVSDLAAGRRSLEERG